MSGPSSDSNEAASPDPAGKPCPCGGEDSREAPSTAPHSNAEILVQIQGLTAPLPATLSLTLQTLIDDWVSHPADRPMGAGLPLYLTTHSILC